MPEHINPSSNAIPRQELPSNPAPVSRAQEPLETRASNSESTVQISAEAIQRLNAEQSAANNIPANPVVEASTTETDQTTSPSQPATNPPPPQEPPQQATTSGSESERQLLDLYA